MIREAIINEINFKKAPIDVGETISVKNI